MSKQKQPRIFPLWQDKHKSGLSRFGHIWVKQNLQIFEPGVKIFKKVRSPKSATTHKNIDTDYDMVISARRVTLVQIVDTLGLSYDTVNASLHG